MRVCVLACVCVAGGVREGKGKAEREGGQGEGKEEKLSKFTK